MAAAAKQVGAEIRTGAEIAEIRVKDGVATGVVLASGKRLRRALSSRMLTQRER